MGNYSGIGDVISGTMDWIFWWCVISIPLAIWKLIDIAIWLYHHVHIGVTL